MPDAAGAVVHQQLTALPQGHARSAFSIGALVSLLVAVGALSTAFRAVMQAMNTIYGVEEGRPFWKLYLVSLLLSVALAALLVGALAVVVFGSSITHQLARASGLGVGFRWAWTAVMWPSLLVFVLSAFALAYYFAPDVRQRFRWISAGSVIAVSLWFVFTILFSLYINNFVAYTETYGALAGIAVLMIYLYGVAYILLLGAELNQVIEVNHPEGKNVGERVPPGEDARRNERQGDAQASPKRRRSASRSQRTGSQAKGL